jgi:hypothetical protein
MYSVRKGEQPCGTMRNEDCHEQGPKDGADEGGADCLGEKRERKRRVRSLGRFKFWLSHAKRTSMTKLRRLLWCN